MTRKNHNQIQKGLDRESINLTAEQVCKQVGISRPTLSRLCRAGKIGFFRIGVRVLFSPEHVSDFLQSVEQKPSEVSLRKRVRAA